MKKEEYIITKKRTGEVVHDGTDRRSILPNAADFRNQVILIIFGSILSAMIVTLGYCGDMAYKGIMASIDKIYERMSIGRANRDNQVNWIFKQCCENAKTDPPALLPQ